MFTWRIFTDPFEQEPWAFKRVINITLERARELGIKVFAYSLSCWELIECPERPTESIFINVNGDVSPCVFLNLPIKGNYILRCFMKRCFRMKKVIFGNINNESVTSIWNNKDYREFRSKFIRRRIQGLTADYSIDLTPPSQCITCYRLYGVYALPILRSIIPLALPLGSPLILQTPFLKYSTIMPREPAR
ncbi:SPASM domain-containing protein [Vulcanisaeta souniana]|uniref:4Fe4S-binding SPASM domain-containing protein n=1 Tax=Vulcanisaeta souniana JCM 11219 TaxID=1293586 RepID=A0ABN6STJ1_9CREN|nr:SPASM domain-containing protein [Vulcanisaeta souniana]BDR92859.1 hypothetical protein Vsou_19520 [Vulcanisaeta souniana JCM 11219]